MFDNRLRDLRISKKLNMRQASELLNIPYTTYVGYEKNEREPNSDILTLIADFFDCSVDYLIGRTQVMETNHKDDNVNEIILTEHETNIIFAYRNQIDMQKAVDRLLQLENIKQENVFLLKIARSQDNSEPIGTIELTTEQLERLQNAKSVDEDI